MQELQESLKDLPADKATGEDEVHNSFLKNLPDHTLRELLGLINGNRRNEVFYPHEDTPWSSPL